MATPSEETKSTAGKMTLGGIGKSLMRGVEGVGRIVSKPFSKKTPDLVMKKEDPAEVLGEIYKMLKLMDEDKKLNHQMANNHLEAEELKKEQRNKEIIKALTGKKPKGEVRKVYRDEKGRFTKEPGKKEVAPEVPAPKTGEVKTTPKTTTGEKPPTVKPAEQPKVPEKMTQVEKPPAPKIPKATTTKPAPAKQPKVTTPAPQAPVAPAVTKPPILPSVGTVVVGVAAIGLSEAALAKIKEKEKYSEKAYFDPHRTTPFYSVGYGHQITQEEVKSGFILIGDKKIPVRGDKGKDTTLTKQEADELVKQDYVKYEKYAKTLPNFDKLNQKAQMALIDMTYNMGVGWAKPFIRLRKGLETLDMKLASESVLDSKYAKDVGKRAIENAAALKNGLEGIPKQQNIPIERQTGNQIDASSIQNKDLKKELNPMQSSSTNTTIINNQPVTTSPTPMKEDDRSPMNKKAKQ